MGAGQSAEQTAAASGGDARPTERVPTDGHRFTTAHRGYSTGSMRGLFSEEDSEADDEVDSRERWCPWCAEMCSAKKESRGCCYLCFTFAFALFTLVFPLFFYWIAAAPMPHEYWNEAYPRFPVLQHKEFIQDRTGWSYDVNLSDVPTSLYGCNYSCIGSSSHHDSSEMSFPVQMTLEAGGFEHTAYPVLLASNDFHTWWVATDREDASPTPFFPSHSQYDREMYRLETEQCNKPPVISDPVENGFQPLKQDEIIGSSPLYVMVCVAWEWESIQWHAENTELNVNALAQHCQAVGGVCGMPCGTRPSHGALPGCSAQGVLNVDTNQEALADYVIPGADFQGHVTLQACIDEPGSKECTTSTSPMSDWPCHKCAVNGIFADPGATDVTGNQSYQLRYNSLPKMEVVLENVELPNTAAVPRAYIFTSAVTPEGAVNQGPDAIFGGRWKKLYYDHNMVVSDPFRYPHPQPLSILEAQGQAEVFESSSFDVALPAEIDESNYVKTPLLINADHSKMTYVDQSTVTLKSDACFASRGPLYIVACAVNESLYADFFKFSKGQEVAPPPFNDRCLTVKGKCGMACTGQQADAMPYCDANGEIPLNELRKEFEMPVNDTKVITIFMVALIFGFTVKLMTYFPGLFSPDKHPQRYNPRQTEQFKYIAVCMPSGGESKAVCVRNMVGAMSALPHGCQCAYHVVFADEGHRHPQKICFRALVAVFHAVPEVRLSSTTDPDAGAHRRGRGPSAVKEENLKAFARAWVEQTRTFTLKDCETGKMQKKIKELSESGQDPGQVKSLNDKIDKACGLQALRRLQDKMGWPKGDASEEVRNLEAAILRLRDELVCGEKDTAIDREKGEVPRPVHADDCEAYHWQPTQRHPDHPVNRLYTMHYVARGKPEEDERTLKVQHVARGTWYYKIPRDSDARAEKSWLQWREKSRVYQDGDNTSNYFIVPLRTSRGKAGGLNFVENYLYDYCKGGDVTDVKHGLFSIADARHQYQPDFFSETIPFFFKQNNTEVDFRVAFTQSPQYFPEMPDDIDYLDTNNANFFRLNCMLRNCCGGVSSCGTNGTWLIRDRRAGQKGVDSIWEEEHRPRLDFLEKLERRFFHESCKVEDTASSLDRVVKGKFSQYVNRRLSYGMAKDPTDYLAAVQRWSEGGVVLALQTFLSCHEGIHMIWMAFFIFIGFVASLINMVYGTGYKHLLETVSRDYTANDALFETFDGAANWFADRAMDLDLVELWARQVWVDMFLHVTTWLVLVIGFFTALAIITTMSHYFHYSPCCCGLRKRARRTRFPTSMAQWARLAITLDNLTYFLWFWTAFFWVGFNYYGIWGRRWYHFDANAMVFFSYLVQVLGWSMVITSTLRYRTEQGQSANEVFFLSLTNIWRTTQLFYITAPLTLFSLLVGTSDFLRNRMLDVDISYWVGGDRGAVSKSIAQWWTLALIVGAFVSHIFFWSGWLPHGEFGGLLIITFVALDVMHPCAFLWLSVPKEKLPDPPKTDRPGWQRAIMRYFQIMFSGVFYRNLIRAVLFHPRSTSVVKWIGPVQNVLFPVLTWFIPSLGINQALLLLAANRT